jgi:predicted RNase H-like HicB family nuclease
MIKIRAVNRQPLLNLQIFAMSHRKTLEAILSGTSDHNIRFSELTGLLQAMGFSERIRGGHHLYSRSLIREIIDLQPEGSMCKGSGATSTQDSARESFIGSIMNRYEIIIYWSDADGRFIAEVPELPGCMADGMTYQACLLQVEDVMREWLDYAKELGRPIPEPKGRLMYA